MIYSKLILYKEFTLQLYTDTLCKNKSWKLKQKYLSEISWHHLSPSNDCHVRLHSATLLSLCNNMCKSYMPLWHQYNTKDHCTLLWHKLQYIVDYLYILRWVCVKITLQLLKHKNFEQISFCHKCTTTLQYHFSIYSSYWVLMWQEFYVMTC